MTATYVAWNGKPYPHPPPDGWYHASDGRWWASGTGPNPPARPDRVGSQGPSQHPNQVERANLARGQTSAFTERSETVTADQPSAPSATNEADEVAPPGRTATAKGEPPNKTVGATGTDAASPPEALAGARAVNDGRSATVDSDTTQDTVLHRQRSEPSSSRSRSTTAGLPRSTTPEQNRGEKDAAWKPKPRPRRRKRDFVLGGFVVAAVATAAVFGFLLVTSGDDAGENGVATAAGSESAAAVDSEPTTPTTSTTADSPTISVEPPTDTTPSTTTVTEAVSTTATFSPEEQVALFRANLDANDLSSELLTAEDVIEFGNSFCTFAIISGDGEAFDVYRQRALVDSTGELTPEELSIAIDQALIVFCPQHAARLGVVGT